MIFGECPYCSETVCNAMPESSPVVFKSTCDSCGNDYWMYASRVQDCEAFTEEDFFKTFEINDHDRSFKRIDVNQPRST